MQVRRYIFTVHFDDSEDGFRMVRTYQTRETNHLAAFTWLCSLPSVREIAYSQNIEICMREEEVPHV